MRKTLVFEYSVQLLRCLFICWNFSRFFVRAFEASEWHRNLWKLVSIILAWCRLGATFLVFWISLNVELVDEESKAYFPRRLFRVVSHSRYSTSYQQLIEWPWALWAFLRKHFRFQKKFLALGKVLFCFIGPRQLPREKEKTEVKGVLFLLIHRAIATRRTTTARNYRTPCH